MQSLKELNIYQQLQFAIIIFMFFAWAVTGTICIVVSEPFAFVTNLYGKLEAVFFTLASMKALEDRILKAQGGNADEKIDTPAVDTSK